MTYATYVYDVFGNRIEKDVWTSTGGNSITRYGFDGDQAWSDLNSSNGLQNRYLRGDIISELFARISSAGVPAWYLPDHLGSIRNLTDNTGTLIDTIAYDAYGKVTSESNPANGDIYKWAELQYDAATGLNFAKARPEAPSTGRWLEQDLIGFFAGDKNLYRYSFNDPTISVDPLGLASNPLPGIPVAKLHLPDGTWLTWVLIGGIISFGTWGGPGNGHPRSWFGFGNVGELPTYANLRDKRFDPGFNKRRQEAAMQAADLASKLMWFYATTPLMAVSAAKRFLMFREYYALMRQSAEMAGLLKELETLYEKLDDAQLEGASTAVINKILENIRRLEMLKNKIPGPPWVNN